MQPANTLNTFLHFGYLPITDGVLPFPPLEKKPLAEFERGIRELALEAKGIWRRAIISSLESANPNAIHIVPISGGLDSRLVLAGLLEHISPRQVRTVTFGEPGSWDFEIGRLVATRAGVKNVPLRAEDIGPFSVERLRSFAESVTNPVPLFEALTNNQAVTQATERGALVWSGFIGDRLAGTDIPRSLPTGGDKAVLSSFCRANKYPGTLPGMPFAEALKAVSPAASPHSWLPSYSWLDYSIRQRSYSAPTIFHPSHNYAKPFLFPEWVRFWLSAPNHLREGQLFYRDFLQTAYPDLFTLPVKLNRGLPLSAGRTRIVVRRLTRAVGRVLGQRDQAGENYFSYDRLYSRDATFRDTVCNAIESLDARNVLAFSARSFLPKETSRTDFGALLLLVSAEAYIQAGRIPSAPSSAP